MKNNKGITLIALIITIIIMLILVAVSISILINSGLIGKAKEGAEKTKSAYEEEQKIGDSININGVMYNSIEEVISLEHNELPAGIQIPDITKDRWRLVVTNFFESSGKFTDDGNFYLDGYGTESQGTWTINGEELTVNAWGETLTLSWNGESFVGQTFYGGGEPMAASLTKINCFKFKIDGVEYLADEGSEWIDWVYTVDAQKSGYKLGTWTIFTVIKNSSDDIVLNSRYAQVDASEEIEPGATYICGTPVEY